VSWLEVFALPEFRALWSAQALSSAGDQFAQVALTVVVYARTGSPFLTAVAYALTYLPPIAGGPLLSGLADLFPRQQLMIALDVARAGLVALMALPGLPLPLLGVLFAVTVVLGVPFSTARSALLPSVLPRRLLPSGLAIGNSTAQLGQVAGLVVGGAVVAVAGPYRALAVDSLSFSLSAGILAQWVRPRPAPPTPATGCTATAAWEITWTGLRAVFSSPVLRILVLFGWLAGFAVVPEALAMPYACTLGGGRGTGALLMAALPAGTVAGGFVLGRFMRPSDRMRPMGWLAMLSCAPLLFAVVRPPLPVVLLLWALAGAGAAYQFAAAAAFVRALPPAHRVRSFAVAQSGLLAAQGLGAATGGAVAQRMGPQTAITLAGLTGLLVAAALATSWTARHGELITSLDGAPGDGCAGDLGAVPDPPLPPARQKPPARPLDQPWPWDVQATAPDLPPMTGRHHRRPAGHRAPRDLRVPRDLAARAWLTAARFLDQLLGDRVVLPFFGDDDPPGQVDQRAHTGRDQGQGQEDEPDDGRVDAQIIGDGDADAGHHPAFPRAD
jgi:Major Facilitator Superfamily